MFVSSQQTTAAQLNGLDDGLSEELGGRQPPAVFVGDVVCQQVRWSAEIGLGF